MPAASRPSKITTIRAPSARTHSWTFINSACSRYSSFSYGFLGTRRASSCAVATLTLPFLPATAAPPAASLDPILAPGKADA